jgi:hypothetical protein
MNMPTIGNELQSNAIALKHTVACKRKYASSIASLARAGIMTHSPPARIAMVSVSAIKYRMSDSAVPATLWSRATGPPSGVLSVA